MAYPGNSNYKLFMLTPDGEIEISLDAKLIEFIEPLDVFDLIEAVLIMQNVKGKD